MQEKDRPPKATKKEIEDLEEEPVLRPQGKGMSQFDSATGKTAIVSFIVSVIVILGLGFIGGGEFLTKQQFEDNLAGITDMANQAKAELVSAQVQIDTSLANINTTLTTQVNNAVAQAINQVNSQISSLTTQLADSNRVVSALQDRIGVLETKIVNYEARFIALETKVVPTEQESDVVTAQLKTWGDIVFYKGEADNTLTADIRLTLENTGTKDIEDLELTVSIMNYPASPTLYSTPTLSGMTGWRNIYASKNGVAFTNTWGLDLDTAEVKQKMLTLTIVFEPTEVVAMTSDVWYEDLEITVEDYSIVK